MNRWTVCKLCGGSELEKLYDLPRAKVQVQSCRSCGFAFVDVLYDDATAADLYSRELTREGEYERYEARKEARATERAREIVEIRTGGLRGMSVLDVGAGGGCFLNLMRQAGAEVRGIEFAESARAFALDRYGIRLDPLPLEDPTWGVGSADLITLWDVLEHIQDPARLISRAAEVLRPGGLLALTTPARDSSMHAAAVALFRATRGRADVLLRHHFNWLHLQAFRTRDLDRLLADRGFRVHRMRKLLDISYPPTWYFRESLGRKTGGETFGLFSRLALTVVPLRNKILAYAIRESN